jgi:hypothetical protein
MAKSSGEFEELIKDAYQDKLLSQTTRILAWTNLTVHRYNTLVRNYLGYPPDFQIGEPVTLGDSVRATNPSEFISGDTLFKVTVKRAYDNVWKGVPIYYIVVESEKKYQFQFRVANSIDDIKAALKEAASIKDWTTYFSIKDQIADLRACYASTCHKAQGSTFDTVFIDVNDISKNTKWHEIARLMYVAISRARSKVVLYGQLR